MSLLMDALKKAEKEKKRSAELDDTASVQITSGELPPADEEKSAEHILPDVPAEKETPPSVDAGDISGEYTDTTELTLEPLGEDIFGMDADVPAADIPEEESVPEFEPTRQIDSTELAQSREKTKSLTADIAESTILSGASVDTQGYDQESTLPSERAIQSSLKDYFEASQSIEREKLNISEPKPVPPMDVTGEGSTTTRVSAHTIFATTTRTTTSRWVKFAVVASLILVIALGAIAFNFYFNTPVTRRTPSPMVERTIQPPVAPQVAEAPVTPESPVVAVVPSGTGLEEGVAESTSTEETVVETERFESGGEAAKPPQDEDESLAAAFEAVERATGTTPPEVSDSEPQTQKMAASPTVAKPSPPRMATPSSAVKISRGIPKIDIDRQINRAYKEYLSGNYVAAEHSYRRVLMHSPDNRDALLGMAAIARNRGDNRKAISIYSKLLELNPQDTVASAALFDLNQGATQNISEARLRMMLDNNPDAAYLHFSLGNVYAKQSRWAEAQEEFFSAYNADRLNPEYAMNLAVSLDHLGQGEAALPYYRRVVEIVKRQRVAFNTSPVQARIQELSRVSGSQ